LLRITRVPQLSNNSISKTRIIEITINYIAIDMKARIQRLKEVVATSKWLSHLTISMTTQPEPPIIATLAEVRLKEGLKDSTLIEGWKEQTRASC
jgi:hypothetical protein